MLQDTRAALEEFQESSRELEEELEKELQTTEKAYKDLKSRCEQYKYEADDWKVKGTKDKEEGHMDPDHKSVVQVHPVQTRTEHVDGSDAT